MRKLLTASLLVLAGAAFVPPLAQAAAPGYADGDLFLGFRLDNGSQDYLIDIGPASLYTVSNGSVFTVTNLTVNGFHLSALGADLTSTFGATWTTGIVNGSTNYVHWGVAGTDLASDPASTTYVTQPEVIIGTRSGTILRPNGSAQSQANTQIEGLAYAYTGGYRPSYTQTSAGGEVQGSADPSSYASVQPPSESTSYGVYANTEGIFNNGSAGTALDLYQVVPNNTAGTPSAYEGRFTISDTGVVTFQAVPEPSSALLLLAGITFCGFIRRRPSTQA